MLSLLYLLAFQAAPPPPRLQFVEPAPAREVTGEIGTVAIHPLFNGLFVCGDHAVGDSPMTGDALGTDCMALSRQDGDVPRLYRGDGARNEDWYGWGAEVLAPFDGEIVGLFANGTINEVGVRGRPPAGMLQVRRADGVIVLFAHVTDIAVAAGDRVRAGQPIARVGNNGPSYSPHIHVGAFRADNLPLQIRWDQRALAETQKKQVRAPAPAAQR